MKKNIINRIWDSHVIKSEPGAPDVVWIDQQLLHEVTSPQAFDVMRKRNLQFAYPERNIATIDHSIPTDPKRENYADRAARTQVEKLRKNCTEFGIELLDAGSGDQGIVHIIGPEMGVTQPGITMVCGDSHTSTHGAFGALAFGIGTTQIGHVMATQSLLLDRPRTMKVEFIGTPTKYFTAKDAVLALINQIGIQGGTGHAMEFCGEYIQNLSMESRMTICNMSIECGAKFGLISPDAKTIEYLENRLKVIQKCKRENITFAELSQKWLDIASPVDAEYDTIVQVDISDATPYVTWGTNPEQSVPVDQNIPHLNDFTDPAKQLAAEKSLDYTQLKPGTPINGTPIDYVFVGSCTNARIEDFRVVAEVLKNQKIHPNVKCFLVPGSEKVRAQIIEEGIDQIFVESGADFRMSGCSMCLAMNGDQVPSGARCASTSNRNFVGRQGNGSFTHLMSPLMASIAAVTGQITDPDKYFSS